MWLFNNLTIPHPNISFNLTNYAALMYTLEKQLEKTIHSTMTK